MTAISWTAAAVTGAASGIGRALALAFSARGCDLALADRDEAGLAAAPAARAGQAPAGKVTRACGSMSELPEADPGFCARPRSRHIRTSTSSSTMPAWR